MGFLNEAVCACYLDIVGSFLLNNFQESNTDGLAPTNQEPQDADVVSFEKHQPLCSPWELPTMLSTHRGMVGTFWGDRQTDRQVFLPALPTVNVCVESLIPTVGTEVSQPSSAAGPSGSASLHTAGAIALHWASQML